MSSSRRRAFYLLVLILMGLFAHSVGGYVPFFLFVFTLCLYLGDATLFVLGAQGIALNDQLDLEERAMVGRDYPLGLIIGNVASVPLPWLTSVVRAGDGVEVKQAQPHCGVVQPRERRHIQAHLCFTRRGRYDRFFVHVTLSDLLGLFDHEWIVERRIDLIVLPRILPIVKQLDGAGLGIGYADLDRHRSEDVAQTIGVRQYVQGDSIRRVHWRTTAKTGQLMVKTYAHQSKAQVYLYLDCCEGRQGGTGDDSTFERAVVVAASLANYLLTRRIATGLVAAGAPTPIYRASDHLIQQSIILDALALVDTIPSDGTPERAALELDTIPAGSLVVLISTMASEELKTLVISLQARNIKAVVVQFDLQERTVHDTADLHEHLGFVPWVVAKAEDDLTTVLGEVTHAFLG